MSDRDLICSSAKFKLIHLLAARRNVLRAVRYYPKHKQVISHCSKYPANRLNYYTPSSVNLYMYINHKPYTTHDERARDASLVRRIASATHNPPHHAACELCALRPDIRVMHAISDDGRLHVWLYIYTIYTMCISQAWWDSRGKCQTINSDYSRVHTERADC